METKLDPRIIEAVQNGKIAKRDWKAIAKRIEHYEGQWVLIETTPDCSDPGIADHIRNELKRVNYIAQVVAIRGMMINQRPWTGWAVYARTPRSRRQPLTDKLF